MHFGGVLVCLRASVRILVCVFGGVMVCIFVWGFRFHLVSYHGVFS